MKLYDFKIQADADVVKNMGTADGEIRCRTNNDGSGLFIGSGNEQLLDNGHYPTERQIRDAMRHLLTRRWQDNTRRYGEEPKFKLILKQII